MDNEEKDERLAIMMASGMSEREALAILEPPKWMEAIERMKAMKKPQKFKMKMNRDTAKLASGDDQ